MSITNLEYKKTYQEYKAELDTELQKSAEGFVRIGYLLKVARDTDILSASGYKSMAEFAAAEYNLDKTQVSRFVNINDRFSVGGYSDRLAESYQGYGYAKLTIMLQLPEEINEILTPEYTKAEIQAIKEEVEAEKEITDLEVLMEKPSSEELAETVIQRVLRKLGEDDPELYLELAAAQGDVEKTMEIMVPNGVQIYSVRVPGTGKLLLVLSDQEECRIVNVRTGDKEVTSWEEITEAWNCLLDGREDAKRRWARLYGMPFPEVAPVQPERKEEKKPEAKKKNRVSKAVVDKKSAKPEPEEQLEEQRDNEQYPAGLPDNEIETDSNETDTDNDGMPQKYNVELDQEMLYQATNSFEKLQTAMVTNMYSIALDEARSLVHYLEAAGVR